MRLLILSMVPFLKILHYYHNIIDNSLKYSDKIEIKLNKKNTNLFITIDDNGPGVSSKEYDNVFKYDYSKVDVPVGSDRMATISDYNKRQSDLFFMKKNY